MRISWQVDNEAPAARSARPSQRAAPCGGTTTDGLREAMTFASVVLVLCVYRVQYWDRSACRTRAAAIQLLESLDREDMCGDEIESVGSILVTKLFKDVFTQRSPV